MTDHNKNMTDLVKKTRQHLPQRGKVKERGKDATTHQK